MVQIDFEQDIEKRKKYRSAFNRVSNIIGGIKLCLSLIIFATVYTVWVNHFPAGGVLLIAAEAVVFVIACIYHDYYIEKVHHEEGLIAIHQNNIMRKNGKWQEFSDIGEEYIDENHDYAMDLDIVGARSLFQFLNSTYTYYGRTAFSKDLLHARYSKKEIEDRQKAVAELGSMYEFASELEYRFSKIELDREFPELVTELKRTEKFLKHSWMKVLLCASQILTMASILWGIFTTGENKWAAVGIMLSVQIILCILGAGKIKSYIHILYRSSCKIDAYNPVLEWICGQEFKSDKMKGIKEQVQYSRTAVKKLSLIYEHVSQCHNGIMKMILDAFFLWSYKNALDLEIWKQKYGASIEGCFLLLGELESLLSFANLPRVCEGVSLPEYREEDNVVRAEGLGHPLIGNEKRVCNDMTLCREIFIISGSNMSGKTTFMRTVGINLVLAYAGSFVCAGRMSCSGMRIVTSMRIVDDLKGGTSTFYAELKKIKRIIDLAGRDKHTLFLIDEIFRGTNSVDRMKGAEGVLKELWRYGAAGMITTHDLEICRLAEEEEDVKQGDLSQKDTKPSREKKYQNIVNYSFCETYQGDEIQFDYRLRKGRSTTTNGEYLLKQIGIL